MTELRGHPAAGPAWGGGHLSLDAIVAYVDEELSPGAHRRALEHLSRCPGCAGEVVAQTQARWALRASAAPSLPSSLLSNLRAIPQQAEIPGPPAGLAVGPDGQLVSVLREPREHRRRSLDRRARFGAGAVVSGLALGALMVSADASVPVPTAAIGGGGPGAGTITAGSLSGTVSGGSLSNGSLSGGSLSGSAVAGLSTGSLTAGEVNQPVLNVPHPALNSGRIAPGPAAQAPPSVAETAAVAQRPNR